MPSKLKRSLRVHDSSTNINIFILLSSLTAPGKPNHAYSINKRHAQCSQVSVSIHTHPQIPWQKLFVFTRACNRDRKEKKHWDKDRERRERCKKSWRTNLLQNNVTFCNSTQPVAELLYVQAKINILTFWASVTTPSIVTPSSITTPSLACRATAAHIWQLHNSTAMFFSLATLGKWVNHLFAHGQFLLAHILIVLSIIVNQITTKIQVNWHVSTTGCQLLLRHSTIFLFNLICL